jgi:hypothetical protein
MRGGGLPTETAKVHKWMSGSGSGSGFEVGVQILGCGGNLGRQVSLPNLNDATFERLQDVITCVVFEVINCLKLHGAFCVLDNVENLSDQELADMLMTFRDTLFSIPGMWWIIIGQSGLYSLIQTQDPRVSERISGTGLELRPLAKEELHDAIERRVKRFHKTADGKAPLPSETHDHLYEASRGEIRFVFKYSNSICARFIKEIRVRVLESVRKENPGSTAAEMALTTALLDKEMGKALIHRVMPAAIAEAQLRQIVEDEIRGIKLKPHDAQILSWIGQHSGAHAKDFKEFGLKSMQDFSSNYLAKFHKLHLLNRQQEGRGVLYTLRGIAAIGAEYGLLSSSETSQGSSSNNS